MVKPKEGRLLTFPPYRKGYPWVVVRYNSIGYCRAGIGSSEQQARDRFLNGELADEQSRQHQDASNAATKKLEAEYGGNKT